MQRNGHERLDLGRLIGSAIRRSRLECRWSQAELAERLHTTQSQVSRLESGSRAHLDVDLASRAFNLLGIRPLFDAQTLGISLGAASAHASRARVFLGHGTSRWKREDTLSCDGGGS